MRESGIRIQEWGGFGLHTHENEPVLTSPETNPTFFNCFTYLSNKETKPDVESALEDGCRKAWL